MPFVQVDDELTKAAVVAVDLALALGPAVLDPDLDARVQERELAEAVGEDVVVEDDRLEDRRVGHERDHGPGHLLAVGLDEGLARGEPLPRPLAVPDGVAVLHLLLRLLAGDERAGLAPDEVHLVHVPVAVDRGVEPGRERVHDRDADAVESARDLVGVLVELAAGVEDGQDGLDRGLAGLLDPVHGDAPAVVLDRARAVLVDRHPDMVAEPAKGLVHRVVHDLVHEVMQPAGVGRADVHGRPFPHRLQPLQYGDMRCVVGF